jgi:hypothetical protein
VNRLQKLLADEQPGTNASGLIHTNAAKKSRRRSQDIRFVIARHSPGEFEKSDYSLGQRRKDAYERLNVLGSAFSPVRFDNIFREIRASFGKFETRCDNILCGPDCVAERGKCEPSVQVTEP